MRLPGLLLIALTLAGGLAQPRAAEAPELSAWRDPLLEQVIDTAVRKGPLMAARRSEVSAVDHEVTAARWQFAPVLSSQLQAGTGSATQYGNVLRADQRLYTGGRLESDLANAVSRRESAQLSVREGALLIGLQVASDWRLLQAALGDEQAIARYRARLDDLDGTIGRRIASGVSPPSEQALMDGRRAQLQNDIAAARAQREAALAGLERLAGPLTMPAVAPGPIGDPPDAPALCDAGGAGQPALAEALDAHPALLRATQDLESARLALESQRAGTRPSVSLRFEQPVGALPAGASRDPRLSVVLEYSTDASLTGAARANATAARLSGLRDAAEEQRREVRRQLAAECAEYTSAAMRVRASAAAQAYGADVLASYTRLFVAGKRGWLDLLNAARENFENERGGAAAAAALRSSALRLALLAGRYPLPGEPMPAPHAATRSERWLDGFMRVRSAIAGAPERPKVALASQPPGPAAGASAPATATAVPVSAHSASQPSAQPTPPATEPAQAAVTPAPSPAAAPAADGNDEARAAVEAWAAAWSRRDVAAYVAAYVDDHAGRQGSHDAWVAERSKRIGARRRIEVSVSDLELKPLADGFDVRFTQTYVGDGHRETGRKALLLRRVGGVLRIAEERELP